MPPECAHVDICDSCVLFPARGAHSEDCKIDAYFYLNSADEYIELRENRGLLPWHLAREEMLSSRLGGLSLARTRISEEGSVAGFGLFANRAIKKGELITCYPGDALVCLNNEEEGGVNEFVYVCVCVCVSVCISIDAYRMIEHTSTHATVMCILR